MKRIINFASLEDYKKFLEEEKKCNTEIGHGGEGICYLSDKDNQVYKIITKQRLRYEIDKIITTNDINVSQYIFPEQIYIVDDRIVGYRTIYIKERNLFNYKTIDISLFNNNSYFNADSFLTAYYKILKDTKKLSDKGITVKDLVLANLLFTGRNFYGIDTIGYTKVDYNPYNDNKRILDTTIKRGFNVVLAKRTNISSELITDLRAEKDMEKYTKKLVKLINN